MLPRHRIVTLTVSDTLSHLPPCSAAVAETDSQPFRLLPYNPRHHLRIDSTTPPQPPTLLLSLADQSLHLSDSLVLAILRLQVRAPLTRGQKHDILLDQEAGFLRPDFLMGDKHCRGLSESGVEVWDPGVPADVEAVP